MKCSQSAYNIPDSLALATSGDTLNLVANERIGWHESPTAT